MTSFPAGGAGGFDPGVAEPITEVTTTITNGVTSDLSRVVAGLGIAFVPNNRLFMVRGGACLKGEVLEFDYSRADAATSSSDDNNSASVFTNVVKPTSAGRAGGSDYAVMMYAGVDDTPVTGEIGAAIVWALCENSGGGGAVARNDRLTPKSSGGVGVLDANVGAGDVIHAIALAPIASGRALIPVVFSGQTPFGTDT